MTLVRLIMEYPQSGLEEVSTEELHMYNGFYLNILEQLPCYIIIPTLLTALSKVKYNWMEMKLFT